MMAISGYWHCCIILGLSVVGILSKQLTLARMTPTISTTASYPVLDDFFWYFAFGSNLLKERIRVQIKGAQFEAVGHLRNFELAFFDYGDRWKGAPASIEQKNGSEVWGCVWRVPNSFAKELDKQELGYHRLNVTVEIPSQLDEDGRIRKVVCRTYQLSNPNRALQKPSPHYKHVIVSGAIEHELPDHYINELKAIPDNGYKGRVALDLSVIHHLNRQSD
uniref:Gamma-glutamylcyclotransferase n=1 Tax=Panagrolaimus sp. JU765 TaxID=591449 RepID=A0AC34QP05_9BILA